ncbi:MAG: glutaredoxin family protein [Gallionella sp.]
MRHIALLLACLLALLSVAGAGELFRWKDENGRVHYGDAPPNKIKNVERKHLTSSMETSAELPYVTQRAQQNFPVSLYVADSCIDTCKQARDLLKKRGVPYSEKSVNTKQELDALIAVSGKAGVPTLAVGKTYLVGFLESSWNRELNLAGYPETASYRQRVAPPLKRAKPTEPRLDAPDDGDGFAQSENDSEE